MVNILFLFLYLSTLNLNVQSLDSGTENLNGLNNANPTDQSMLWPFVKIHFKDQQVQSPIDILKQCSYELSISSLLYYDYWRDESVLIKIINNGQALYVHTLHFGYQSRYLEIENKLAIITGGPLFDSLYEFNRMYFYWGDVGECGSENQMNDQFYAMEVQMVHFKQEYGSYENATRYDDGICIVSFFGQISDEDNIDLKNLVTNLNVIQTSDQYLVGRFNNYFSWLLPIAEENQYYTFPGSLTKDPYTQCVIWIVYKNTFKISQTQLSTFRTLVGSDQQMITSTKRREIQPLNNRPLCWT
ncbi:Hypothetical protein CINCED_3A019049 [Cinara cedri]|uniref:Alpha-carbonic anhydrase domain-containing protein n=1 Tax=Cinara cedri TaxID=506608 RepID=A0A5E4MI18_9HEMI|nr:Hypothetical protein CINCED_3A019049 [Cinara cedri]